MQVQYRWLTALAVAGAMLMSGLESRADCVTDSECIEQCMNEGNTFETCERGLMEGCEEEEDGLWVCEGDDLARLTADRHWQAYKQWRL